MRLLTWLATFHAVPTEELRKYVYHHADSAAVEHLMAVAAGLDSLVLGEPQILGQVKTSFSKCA